MQEDISEETSDQEQAVSHSVSARKASRESWYGTFLLLILFVAVLAVSGGIGWWVYDRVYVPLRQEKVSISSLAEVTLQSGVEPVVMDESPPVEEGEVPKEIISDIKQESVLVLNGGGVKGSAGEVVALLKKEGYAKVSLGNTTKDYTGVVAYFAPQREGVADEIKKLLLKRYPAATSRGAVEGDKETSGASVVVIVGK